MSDDLYGCDSRRSANAGLAIAYCLLFGAGAILGIFVWELIWGVAR